MEEAVFNQAQTIMQTNSHPPAPAGKIINPLAGLVHCDMCGSSMVMRPYSGSNQPPTLICTVQSCKNVSSYFDLVEARLLDFLRDWIEEYKAEWNRRG